MTDTIVNSRAARRAAALLILAGLLWLVAPLLLAPFSSFRERAEAIETQYALLDRLARLDARQASLASLAALPTPPFLVAADAAAAQGALQGRVSTIAPAEVFRIESLSALPVEEKPGAPVELSVSFSATEHGLYAVLSDLETRPPFVRVRELSVKSAIESGTRVLSGSAVLSAVPFPAGRP